MWVNDFGSQIGRAILFIVLTIALGACNTGFGRSGDNDLRQLTISEGTLTPAFSKAETEYTATVGASTTSIVVNAIVEDENATLQVAGQSVISGQSVEVNLVPGPNEIEIEVTAENELRKVYEIVVTKTDRSSNDASLKSLELKNIGLDTPFSGDQLTYGTEVNYLVNQTAVSLEKNFDLAKAQINTQEDGRLADNQMSDPISLPAGGTRKIEITVEAEDGSNTNNYEIDINRGERDELALANFVKSSNSAFEDRFGISISASGDRFVAGAPAEDSAVFDNQNDDSADAAGAAYVFENSGGVWSQTRYLKASSGITAGDRFGESVAVDGDWVAVGAPGRNSESGIVFVFNRVGLNWESFAFLRPEDTVAGDKFGATLEIKQWTEAGSEPTYYLIVGAPGRSSGQGVVYVYRLFDGQWLLESTETASDGQGGDAFGTSLSLNTSSPLLEYAVGAPGRSSNTGAVYVFRKAEAGTEWFELAAQQASNPSSGDRFGSAVALRRNTLAAGAPGERSSSNGVFNFNSGDTFLDDEDAESAGAAYVFTREDQNSDFFIQAYFKGDRDQFSEFGSSLALSSGMLAIGAPKDDSGAIGIGGNTNSTDRQDSGAVYVFSLTEVTWNFELFAKSANSDAFDEFGYSLAFIGENLYVGIPGENSASDGVDAGVNEDAINAGALHIIR